MIDNYEILDNGLIKQIETKPISYDIEYVNRYNKYGDLVTKMSHLRLGYLIGSLGFIPNSILDIGYGGGDFLKSCVNIISDCYGNDISEYGVPEGVKYVNNPYEIEVDVVTLYDVLEHFENIYDIKNLKTKYIIISVPECHNFSDEWFLNWKHRRPDEHLWHFNTVSLINFMNEIGYFPINTLNLEDTIRKNGKDYSNILTGIFKKSIRTNEINKI